MNRIDQKFAEQLEVIKASKKEKEKKKPTFKYRGNEYQYDFNSDILSDIEEVLSTVSGGRKSHLEKQLADIAHKIKKRNKLLVMADRSEQGWDAVKEYLTDDVASDSDDARKMKQAEKRAAEKKKKKEKAKPYDRYHSASKASSSRSSGVFSGQRYNEPPWGKGEGYWKRSSEKTRGEERCFGCGKRGHYRNQCTERDERR